MGTDTKIPWSTHSWNPWIGCARVSAGCDHCYMFREQARYGQNPAVVRRTAPATWGEPDRWVRSLTKNFLNGGFETDFVFTCSQSDFFHPDADGWREEAWEIIFRTAQGLPYLTWLILTKRPERLAVCLPDDWQAGYPNVWLGATVEEQETLGRLDALLDVPAAGHFVSLEPMLGMSALLPYMMPLEGQPAGLRYLRWVIAGCESGPERRRSETGWFQLVRDYCLQAGVPYFLKQMDVDGSLVKMPALDGRVWDGMPG